MISTAESTSVSESAETPPVMPNPPTQPTSESPLHKAERRFADMSALWPVAHGAGLQNLRGIWEDARIKRKMDRLAQARALGVEEALNNDGNNEMPGDIKIGDENHYHNYPAAPAQSNANAGTSTTSTGSTTTTEQSTTAPARTNWLLPAAIGAACLLGGAGLGSLMHHAATPVAPTTPNQRPADQFDYRYGIEQRPTPK